MHAQGFVWDGALWVPMLGSSAGAVVVSGSAAGAVAAADNMANPTAGQMLTYPLVYDGATWDRWRGTQVAGAANTTEMLAPGAEDNTNNVIAQVNRPIAASTYAPTLYTNFGAAAAAFVKASAGNVLAVTGHSINTALRYLQLHNKATIPLAGEVPLYSWILPAGTATVPSTLKIGTEFFCGSGAHFSTGIGFAFSTTQATYTAATAGDHAIHLHYK